MSTFTCRICLLPFDNDDRQMRSVFDENETPCKTLGYKLQFVGFLQDLQNDSPVSCQLYSHLCCWCATRVEDAYDLKLQCLNARDAFNKMDSTSDHLLEPEAPVNVYSALKVATARLRKRKVNGLPMTSITSLVLASAHDMFTCVRNVSFSVNLTTSLLANATQYLENILSLLSVVITLKEETPAMKKSAQAIRDEVDLWKMKSSMVNDSASFVRDVTNLYRQAFSTFEEQSIKPDESSFKSVDAHHYNYHIVPEKACETMPPALSDNFTDAKSVLDSSIFSLTMNRTDKMENNHLSLESELPINLSFVEESDAGSVRRSYRSRSIVEPLVYYPPYKKQVNSLSKCSSKKQKLFQKYSSSSRNSVGALDELLKLRDENSEAVSSGEGENKLPAQKKKALNDNMCEKIKSRWKFKILPKTLSCLGGVVPSLQSAPAVAAEKDEEIKTDTVDNGKEADVKEEKKGGDVIKDKREPGDLGESAGSGAGPYICSKCGKVLSCKRNFQAHVKMHSGLSPYKCEFCQKCFSSSWNRSQHERVHTGEKPYVCNICQESFRYNVTLRNHKSKQHGLGFKDEMNLSSCSTD